MMRLFVLFLIMLVFTSCSQKDYEAKEIKDFCHGKIVRSEYGYHVVYFDYYKTQACFVWNLYMPYSIKYDGQSVRYSLLPAFKSVTYNSLKMTIAPRVFPESRLINLKGKDSLFLPFVDLNFYNDSAFGVESGLSATNLVNEVKNLIVEIPCVEEGYIKHHPTFRIGKSKVPVIECDIDSLIKTSEK